MSLNFLDGWLSVVNEKYINTLRTHPKNSSNLLRSMWWTFWMD